MLTEGILFTDLYQLTMAQLYYRAGMHEMPARFDHSFRSYPDYGSHQAGYCIAAGLGPLLDWVEDTRFGREEADVVRSHCSSTGGQLFADDFVEWMEHARGFGDLDVWAVPEGRVIHPNTPITIVEGPLALAQLFETTLLNHLNYATLIATKASRVAEAARGGTVLEFGLRRAPGFAGNTATRSALVGGVHFSSNVGMSHVLGVPSKGTHGHAMVQVFMAVAGGELESFRAFADVYPDDCLLLVDTIDTLESGVPNAIAVFEELKRRGHRPVGIRLDSGDLAHLAVRSAQMLDRAGFEECAIVLSSQLDELTIWQILNQIADEAPRYGVDTDHLIERLVYGVGSRMVTSDGDPSLDGVYKVVAVRPGVEWVPAIKISDTPEKIANPGPKRLWRVYDERGRATADVVALEDEQLTERPLELHHPSLPGLHRSLGDDSISEIEPLLVSMRAGGVRSSPMESLEEARPRRRRDLDRLDPGVRRLVNPHTYHVSLSDRLWKLRAGLIDTYT